MLSNANVYRKRQLLHEAAERLNKTKVIELLKSLRSLTDWQYNFQGETVLHSTLKSKCNDLDKEDRMVEILGLFLQQHMNVNTKNSAGVTVLHVAILNKMKVVIQFLLMNGARLSLNKDIPVGHFIIENEYEEYCKNSNCDRQNLYHEQSINFIDWLLSQKLEYDLTEKNADEDTPLHLAVKLKMIQVLPVLLKHTKDPNSLNKNKKTVLHTFIESICRGDYDFVLREDTARNFDSEETYVTAILKKMMEHGLSVDAVDLLGNTALHTAAKCDKPELIKVLLQNFNNVNVKNNRGSTVMCTLIQRCVDYSNMQHKRYFEKFIEILAQKGANVNLPGHDYNPVQLAVIHVHLPILKVLKKYNADFGVLESGGNLLHLIGKGLCKKVANVDYDEIIKFLINEGCDINARDEKGKTPLHLAVRYSCTSTVLRLLKHGADINIRDGTPYQYTPLYEALERNNEAMVDILLSAGADLNSKNYYNGQTILHQAICLRFKLLKKLLMSGASVNLADKFNCLPLHYAIKNHDVKTVEDLLEYGADINNINTFRDVSNLQNHSLVLDVILNHWILMKTAGLPVLKCYLKTFDMTAYEHLYNTYLIKVETLKCYQITDRVTLYDFLHMDWNSRCYYVNCKKMKDLVDSPATKGQYSKHYILIMAAYHDALERKPLLEKALNAWHQLTEIILPDVCVYRILAHLKNVDLINMIEGC